MISLSILSGLLSLYWIISLFNKNIILGLLFAFLQIYIYIPFAARCFDSNLVDIVSHITITDDTILYKYLFFCYSQSFFLFLLLKKLSIIKIKHKPNFLNLNKISKNLNIYNIIQVLIGIYLSYNLLVNYSSLNYFDQLAVKSNIIWVLLLEYSFVFLLIDFWLYADNKIIKPLLLGLLIFIPAFITLFKIGNRGIAMPALLGYMYIYLRTKKIKLSIKYLKNITIASFAILIIIGFSQFVRVNRGHDSSKHEFSLDMIGDFFDLSVILFQDYTVPGNSLMYSIQKNIIDPSFVIESNIGNGIFFLDYPTIALDISKRINTGEVFGVGGFFPIEGFYLCGYLGIFVMPIVVMLFYYLYFKYLMTGKDKQYDLFIGFLICAFISFNLARGQSYLLFKSIYMYIIPCCFLYRLAFGNKGNNYVLRES